MRRLGVFAVLGVAQAALAAGLLFACDLGLAPFVEPDASPFTSSTPTPDATPVDAAPVPEAGTPVIDAGTDTGAPFVLPPGSKLIFASSTSTTGAMNGVTGADAQCQTLAQRAGLTGTYIAWLSVAGAAAVNRLTSVGPWYLTDKKTRIFKSKASIATTFAEAAINLDESGKKPGLESLSAWSNTNSNGTSAGDGPMDGCAAWTSDVGSSIAGDIAAKGPAWTNSGLQECTNRLHLYCLQP